MTPVTTRKLEMCVYWHMHTLFLKDVKEDVLHGGRGGEGEGCNHALLEKTICQFAYFIYPWVAIPSTFFLTVFATVKLKDKLKITFICMKGFLKHRFFFSPNLNDEDCNRKRRKHFSSAELPSSAKILWAFVTSYMLMPAVPEGIEVCQTLSLIWTCGTSSCFSKGMSHRQNSASEEKTKGRDGCYASFLHLRYFLIGGRQCRNYSVKKTGAAESVCTRSFMGFNLRVVQAYGLTATSGGVATISHYS